MEIAQYIKYKNKTNKIHCFDIGQAGKLAHYNIKLNGFENLISYHRIAASSNNYPTMVFSEYGCPENNRIVNRYEDIETLSYVVNSITIDNFISEQNIYTYLIIKIDTQGADYEVYKGMTDAIKEMNTTFIIEFTPWALKSSIDPEEFLKELGYDNYLFDINFTAFSWADKSKNLREIESQNYKNYITVLETGPKQWSDLLVIPKKLPGASNLVNVILK